MKLGCISSLREYYSHSAAETRVQCITLPPAPWHCPRLRKPLHEDLLCSGHEMYNLARIHKETKMVLWNCYGACLLFCFCGGVAAP